MKPPIPDDELLRRELDRRGFDENGGATSWLRLVVLCLIVVAFLATVAAIAFAPLEWAALPGFIWLYVGVLIVTSAAAAVLLAQEGLALSSASLVILAATYECVCVVYVALFLSFPDVIVGDGQLLGSPGTPVALYLMTNFALLAGIGLSSVIRLVDRPAHVWFLPAGVVCGAVISLAAILWPASTLPTVLYADVFDREFDIISAAIVAVSVPVICLTIWLAISTQARLRWWLVVAATTVSAFTLINMFAGARWTVGWYVPRVFEALASSMIMVVLFAEAAAQSRSMTTLRIRDRLLHTVELEEAANTDPLTGCLNRRGLDEYRNAVFNTAKDKLGVYFIDLDHFKYLNDTYSHEAGDEALKATADALKHSVREDDVVVRYGGDEFVVIVAGLPEESDAQRIANELRRNVASALSRTVPAEAGLSCSVGYLVGGTGEELLASISHAEDAMREAKRSGRNRAFHYDGVHSSPPAVS